MAPCITVYGHAVAGSLAGGGGGGGRYVKRGSRVPHPGHDERQTPNSAQIGVFSLVEMYFLCEVKQKCQLVPKPMLQPIPSPIIVFKHLHRKLMIGI